MDEVGLSLSVSHVPVICADLRTSNVCSPIKKEKEGSVCEGKKEKRGNIYVMNWWKKNEFLCVFSMFRARRMNRC